MDKKFIYTSKFKDKSKVAESSKMKKLFTIRESLKALKRSLREEDEDGEVIETDEPSPAESAEGIADIIDKVEDLVVDAIEALGATDATTQQLISTVGTLETFQDEEEIMASIDAASAESDAIIEEDFEPVYDSFGNVVNEAPDEFADDTLIDDGMGFDDGMGMDDGFGGDFDDDLGMADDEEYIDGMYEKYKAKKKAIAEKKKSSKK